jgi:hypothetical protein
VPRRRKNAAVVLRNSVEPTSSEPRSYVGRRR